MKRNRLASRLSATCFLLVIHSTALHAADFSDVDALPNIDAFPDPLVMFDGTPVPTAKTWRSARRPELMRLFGHYMYGFSPPPPASVEASETRTDSCFDGTKAWSDSAFDVYDEPKGVLLEQVMISPLMLYFGDWSQTFDKRRVLRAARVSGVAAWPRMACAASPGSIDTPRKIISETIKRISKPSDIRCTSILVILFTKYPLPCTLVVVSPHLWADCNSAWTYPSKSRRR